MTPRPDGILETTRQLVELESPSGDEAGCSECAELLAAELERAGADVDLMPAPGWGRHVLATAAGDPALAPIMLLGHLDTVWPAGTLSERPFRVEDGRAAGPGVYDMKVNLAVVTAALHRRPTNQARRPIHILITCDEEVGAPSSRELIEDVAREAEAVLVLEPSLPGGAAKTGRKGIAVWDVHVNGRAAHAGIEPERGVSATAELAGQLVAILGLADSGRGTSVNVGTVRGGTAVNVVAAEASAQVEARFTSAAEAERLTRAISALAPTLKGARLEIAPTRNRPPLKRTAGVVDLYRTARELAGEIGFELREGSTGGASDGCLTAALGVPTLDGLGVQGGGAHADDEHIFIDDVPRRVELLTQLLEKL